MNRAKKLLRRAYRAMEVALVHEDPEPVIGWVHDKVENEGSSNSGLSHSPIICSYSPGSLPLCAVTNKALPSELEECTHALHTKPKRLLLPTGNYKRSETAACYLVFWSMLEGDIASAQDHLGIRVEVQQQCILAADMVNMHTLE